MFNKKTRDFLREWHQKHEAGRSETTETVEEPKTPEQSVQTPPSASVPTPPPPEPVVEPTHSDPKPVIKDVAPKPKKPEIPPSPFYYMPKPKASQLAVIKRMDEMKDNSPEHFFCPSYEFKNDMVADLAVIMVVWGNNDLQIKATEKALSYLSLMTPGPGVFVFLEAQVDGKPRYKSLVNSINSSSVEYLFDKISEENSLYFLKESMMNKAVSFVQKNYPNITKLLFMDSDVYYPNASAFQHISYDLEHAEVLSPYYKAVYVGNNDQSANFKSPLAVEYVTSYYRNKKVTIGHDSYFAGLATAMTMSFYNRMNGIDVVACVSGDKWLWTRIFGNDLFGQKPYQQPNQICLPVKKGLDPKPKIGYSHEAIIHCYHGDMSNRNYRLKLYLDKLSKSYPNESLVLDDNGYPVTRDTDAGKVIKAAFTRLKTSNIYENRHQQEYNLQTVRSLYNRCADEVYGPINDENPLVVCTVLRKGGPYDERHIKALYDGMKEYCLTPFRFVCITDLDINVDGIEVVPFMTTTRQMPYYYSQLECYRPDLWDPKTTSVFCIDIDVVPVRPFTLHQCPRGTVFMLPEMDSMWQYSGSTVLWNGGTVYYRGDYSFIIDAFMMQSSDGNVRSPYITHVSSQEVAAGYLYASGIPIGDIRCHVPLELYNPKEKPEDIALVHFPGNPKPWNLSEKDMPVWMPERIKELGSFKKAYEA